MLLLCCNVNSTFFQTQHDDKQARTIAVQTDPVVCSCHHSHPTVERKSVSVATEDMASNAIVSNDHGYAIKESLLSPSHQQSTYATASSTIVPIQHPPSSDDSSKSSDEQASNMSDEDYIPQSSSSSSDGTDSEQESTSRDESAESVSGMRKFLVFENNLLDLFSMCQLQGCGKPLVTKAETSTKGFALSVHTTCIAGHDFRWNSQPSIKGTAACNVLVPAAIFITGNSYSSFMELCDVMNLQALSTRHCYSMQRRYIIPEIEEMWELHNTAVLSALHGSALVLSGDARCDSPGHCASMGTYSLLDDASGLIIAQETIHVTEVANSYWLEIEGMKRSINKVLVSIDFVL